MRYKLGEIATVTKLAGFEFTKYMKYIPDGEIIAIRALNLKNGTLVLEDVRRIARDVSESLERSRLYKNDIVLSYTGTVGECAQITENGKYHLAPNVCKITPKAEVVDPIFLFQYVRSSLFKQVMLNYCHGSTQPTIPMTTIRELPIEIEFDTVQQRKVADIISCIDDKIALNQQINKNLEEQAQEIFNKYFIDVPDIPDGWSEGSLTDIADYLNGLAMQKFPPMNNADSLPVLKIKELRQGMCDSDSDRCSVEIKPDYIIQDGDVIFSWSGSLLVDFWCGGDCGLNQHLFKVSSAKYDKWFYYSWTIYHLQEFVRMAADRATTMGHIKRDALEKARVLIPCHDDYVKIGNLLQPLYDLIITNRIENRKLADLRDALLPRLMSGEIDVSKIEL